MIALVVRQGFTIDTRSLAFASVLMELVPGHIGLGDRYCNQVQHRAQRDMFRVA